MVRVQKQTYAGYIIVSLEQYELVHGIIDEFGGRVKQFSQDIKHPDDWIIFFEMAKIQRPDFEEAVKEHFVLKQLASTATV